MTKFSFRAKKSQLTSRSSVTSSHQISQSATGGHHQKTSRKKKIKANTQVDPLIQNINANDTAGATNKGQVTPSTIEESIKKYIYAQGLREQSWILFDNLESILKDSQLVTDDSNQHQQPITCPNPLLTTDQIAYIHAIVMTTEKLSALIESTDGRYFTIRNSKSQKNGTELVDSQVAIYRDLRTAIDKMPKSLLVNLRLVRTLNMKLHKYQSQPLPSALNYVGLSDDQIVHQLAEDVVNGRLTLAHNYNVTSDHLARLSNSQESELDLSRLTLHSCLRLRDFSWLDRADWVSGVQKLDLMVMSHLTMENVSYLVEKMIGLKELYIHRCPQINLRVVLPVLGRDQLEVLCLDDPRLSCQPNAYSGVISDKEWGQLLNKSLRTLFINSGNVSLDIIDFFRCRCPNLNQMIVCDGVYQKIKGSLRKPNQAETAKLIIVNAEQKTKMDLPRNFEMLNLLKQQYQAPFSDCMLKKMQEIRQQEMLED